jgi:hypothetical protein
MNTDLAVMFDLFTGVIAASNKKGFIQCLETFIEHQPCTIRASRPQTLKLHCLNSMLVLLPSA